MATLLQKLQHKLHEQSKRHAASIGRAAQQSPQLSGTARTHRMQSPPVTVAPNDPIVPYFLSNPGAVEIDKLHLDSPVLRALQSEGIKVVVPMITQGKLLGLLNLGPRLSEQDYSTDDRGFLNTLAYQAAPAVRVAQLVQEQHIQARERERFEQELRIARLIQQTLLPKELPALHGWQTAAYYQPARAVGGDFYDFLAFEDGRLGIFIGDVTDKGIPGGHTYGNHAQLFALYRSGGDLSGQSPGKNKQPALSRHATQHVCHLSVCYPRSNQWAATVR